MQESSRISMKNRTGMQMSPAKSQEMLDGTADQVTTALPDPEHDGLAEVRAEYIASAEPLGTVPAPLSVTGMVKSATNMLAGNRLQAFVDKLAERAAFERGGTRLYDGLLAKYSERAGADDDDSDVEHVPYETLLEIRSQESEHFMLLSECITELGCDPTAQTPGADVVGMQSMGLVQTVTDPRTTLAQTLSAILTAELVDVAGWDLLAELAEAMGQEDMSRRFREALRHEEQHLEIIRSWYTALAMADSGNPTPVVKRTLRA
jgi:rubrerythrin